MNNRPIQPPSLDDLLAAAVNNSEALEEQARMASEGFGRQRIPSLTAQDLQAAVQAQMRPVVQRMEAIIQEVQVTQEYFRRVAQVKKGDFNETLVEIRKELFQPKQDLNVDALLATVQKMIEIDGEQRQQRLEEVLVTYLKRDRDRQAPPAEEPEDDLEEEEAPPAEEPHDNLEEEPSQPTGPIITPDKPKVEGFTAKDQPGRRRAKKRAAPADK